MLDLKTFFARAYVINLDDDAPRLAEFRQRTSPDRWPFAQPQRWPAVSGKLAPHPDWWRAGNGAWGCFRSHLQIIERCLLDDVASVLILEDDAVPCDDFAERAGRFLAALPDRWDMLYFGGQHLFSATHPPQRASTELSADIYRPYNVNRTHAFALSRSGMKAVYRHLCRNDWHSGQHIDHHLGRMHMEGSLAVYCPRQWLIGQAAGKSRISGRTPGLRFWKDAGEVSKAANNSMQPFVTPFIAIVGLHSSGSSLVAALCWRLGVHLGNEFVGYHRADAEHPSHRGYEASGLAHICEQAARFPSTAIQSPARLRQQLAKWIAQRQREAAKNTNCNIRIAGGKYPHLCRMGEPLQAICGEGLYVVHCDRPLEESIASLQRRVQLGTPKCSAEEADAVQRWLDAGKRLLLADIPRERQITIAYESLLHEPETEIMRLAEFLHVALTPEQIASAVNVVRPNERHVVLVK